MASPHIKDLVGFDIYDIRKRAGSRIKLQGVEQFQVIQGDEVLILKLVDVPGNLGDGGPYKLIQAPCCNRNCRTLRWYKGAWRCARCLQNMGRRYRSQDYRYTPQIEENQNADYSTI